MRRMGVEIESEEQNGLQSVCDVGLNSASNAHVWCELQNKCVLDGLSLIGRMKTVQCSTLSSFLMAFPYIVSQRTSMQTGTVKTSVN